MLDLHYEQGLARLRAMVQCQIPEQLQDFALFQVRLMECSSREFRYGQSSNNDVERRQVIDQLNQFAYKHFSIQFIDLCGPSTSLLQSVPIAASREYSSQQASPPVCETWEGGTELLVKDTAYIIHEPITSIWAADRNVLYQRAKAQELRTDRMVWLKQVQIQRANSNFTKWQAALNKEERLLHILEQEQHHDFPRCLAFDTTTYTATLVHTAMQGQSWAQICQLPDQPLDAQQTRMLLRSSLSLCEMLKTLHRNREHFSHRALSPENILYLKGRARLQDVGRATWPYEPGEGPELYRAPEQRIANRNLAVPGPHTDIYQLGIILYHCLTGHMPMSPQHILPVRTWNETISPEIDGVLQRAIAFNVKERWPTIVDFASALKKVLSVS